MEPIGTVKIAPPSASDEDATSSSNVTTPNSGTPNPAREAACSVADVESLDETLKSCEVAMPRATDIPPVKDKLEIRLATATTSTTPGGRVDLTLVLHNRSNEPLPLYFTGDPNPHFDVEAIDTKGRRADLPANKWPGYPKGIKPDAREVKALRVTLEKGGTAKLKIPWDAVKMKWAPEKTKGWDGRGYPRTPAGPLMPGKYTLRVVVPLIGDVEAPKVVVDVGS